MTDVESLAVGLLVVGMSIVVWLVHKVCRDTFGDSDY
jgi:hypothetical protein